MAAMRKVFAWLGVAALLVLWSVSADAGSGNVLKPYVVLILDTSGSMVGSAYGNPTGFGPPSCGGVDNKLNHAKCAIYNIANSYGDIDIALARFRNVTSGTTTSGTFPSGCCAGGPDGASCGGSSISCTAGDSMFELLAPIIDGTNAATATWVNGTGNTCTSTGTDPEVWNADSNTPLGGVLLGAKDYWAGVQTSTDGTNRSIWPSTSTGYAPIANDPTKNVFLPPAGKTQCNPNPDTCSTAANCTSGTGNGNCCCVSQCRPYITILLTDGDETCGGNAVNAAASMLTTDIGTGANKKRYRVVTKAIGFGVSVGDTQIEDIAHGGGAANVPNVNEGYYAQDEAGLELAISQIIEGSVRSEICNDLDDDCDTRIDEDFPNKGAACDNGLLGACKGTGALGCKADGTGLQCNITNPGASPTAEVCNNADDDCDGKIDEGLTGCVCNPAPEICDGIDQNCNGIPDDGVGSRGCAITNSFGTCPGTQACAPTPGCTGDACYGACSGQTPAAETCDGQDNNCDGVCDGFNQDCSNYPVPKSPASNNLGDPSHNPIPQNVCHPGQMLCPSSCGASNSFGACTGEVLGCNPAQDGSIHCDTCNGLDDDCDNQIDEDFNPQDCSTNCGVGQTQCVNGQIVCNSNPATDDDTCNGVDDDCDGNVDEDWVCDPSPTCTGANCCSCGTGTTCEINQCINGNVTCTQTQPIDPEQCNCNDDDCDGNVDENVTCGAGGACVQCQCAFPCGEGEFPCPQGKTCDMSMGSPGYCVTDPCYNVSCATDGNGNAQVCHPKQDDPTMGECVPVCDTVTCNSPLVCNPKTGDCVNDDCVAFPDKCQANQNCVVDGSGLGQCVTNVCQGVTCPDGQYCEGGNCVASCADVTCPSGQRCRLGVCEADPCGHPCPFGQACHDDTGTCIDDPCQFRNCPQGQWCNPNDGACEADPCVGTMCPSADQICKGGTCYDASQFQPDAGVDQHVTVGGGGGCSTTGGNSGLILGLAMLLVRRRRQGGAK
jgi:hypothetical protein